MQYTTNFSLKKPQYGDTADIADINDNSDSVDNLIHQNRNMIGPAFDSTKAYVTGNPVVYLGELYVFTADKAAGAWDATKVEPTTAAEMGGGGSGSTAWGQITGTLSNQTDLNTRFNGIDAQLNAMKTGFDGVVYPSPAAMVQGCDQKLDDKIDSLSESFDQTLIFPRENKTSQLNTFTPIYIKAGDYFVLKSSDGSSFTPSKIYFFDENKAITDWWTISGNSSPRGITMTSGKNDSLYFKLIGGTPQEITVTNRTSVFNPYGLLNDMGDEIYDVRSMCDKNLIVNYFTIDNKYISSSNGALIGSVNYKTSDFISCKAGDTIQYSLMGSDSGDGLIVKYDKTGAFISTLLAGSGSIATGTLTLDSDCKIRVCNRFASYTSPYIIFNSAIGTINDALAYNRIWSIPDYSLTEISAVVDRVREKQTANTISFAFLTDMHNGAVANIRNANHHAIQSIYKIEHNIPLDYVVFGGDYVSNSSTTPVSVLNEQVRDLMNYITKMNTGFFMLRGNHDSNFINPSVPFTAEMFYKETDKYVEGNSVNMLKSDLSHCCGYKDLENLRIRMVFTNMTDSGNTSDGFAVTDAQIEWFGKVALDFSDKEDKDEWSVIVFAHTYFVASSITEGTLSPAPEMHQILLAFKGGTSTTQKGITYDFSEQGAMSVICAVVGHWHSDRSAVVDGIQVIATMQTAGGGDEPADDGNTYTKTYGTADETAYDIFTINRSTKKIYTTRFGVGVDREWTYS